MGYCITTKIETESESTFSGNHLCLSTAYYISEMPKTNRKYGFFRCTKCNAQWESAHVHCIEGTDNVSSLSLYENIGIPHEPYKNKKNLQCP